MGAVAGTPAGTADAPAIAAAIVGGTRILPMGAAEVSVVWMLVDSRGHSLKIWAETAPDCPLVSDLVAAAVYALNDRAERLKLGRVCALVSKVNAAATPTV